MNLRGSGGMGGVRGEGRCKWCQYRAWHSEKNKNLNGSTKNDTHCHSAERGRSRITFKSTDSKAYAVCTVCGWVLISRPTRLPVPVACCILIFSPPFCAQHIFLIANISCASPHVGSFHTNWILLHPKVFHSLSLLLGKHSLLGFI